LSLPAPNNENTILIYPNPASDHIIIDNGNYLAMAGYTIRIENNAGQQVFQSAINQQQFNIDLSTWSGNGLYFMHLIDPQNNTVTIRKIVLQ
jgi:large exoprotein involved in heme utilization and adhesion